MVPLGLVLLALSIAACEASPEKLLEKSRKISELYAFGELYVPLYQQAIIDSNWTAIRENLTEIQRLKFPIASLPCPENLLLQKQDWDEGCRYFTRAVDNLNIVMGWRGEEAERGRDEIAEGVQHVYNWWGELVKLVR
jgi:hypothetical protein